MFDGSVGLDSSDSVCFNGSDMAFVQTASINGRQQSQWQAGSPRQEQQHTPLVNAVRRSMPLADNGLGSPVDGQSRSSSRASHMPDEDQPLLHSARGPIDPPVALARTPRQHHNSVHAVDGAVRFTQATMEWRSGRFMLEGDIASIGRTKPSFLRKLLLHLRGGRFLLDPREFKLQLWDALIWALAVVFGLVAPFSVAFFELGPDVIGVRYLWFNRCADLLFIFDMFLQFFTMYFCTISMRWIRHPGQIACRYFNELFFIDVLANLPIDVIHMSAAFCRRMSNGTFPAEVLIGILFLLHSLRLFTHMNRASGVFTAIRTTFGLTSAQTQIPGFVTMCAYTSHLLACAWGITGVYGERTGAISGNWVAALRETKGDTLTIHEPFLMYSRSLYWSFCTVTSNGYGDIVPISDLEYAVCTMGLTIAGFIWAYAIGTISNIIGSLDQSQIEFEFGMDKLEVMMGEQDLDSVMKRKLRKFFKRQSECVLMQQDLHLLRMMSPDLHSRIARMQIGKWLENVPYMKDIAGSNQVIMYIRSEVCSTLFCSRETVELPQALCLLRRGIMLKGHQIICRGAVWGQCDVLLTATHLLDSETLAALTFSEVLHIPKRALDMLEEHYPRARLRIRRARVRYAAFRAFVKIGRRNLGRSKEGLKRGDTFLPEQQNEKETTMQFKLQRLEHNMEQFGEQMDKAIEDFTEMSTALAARANQSIMRADETMAHNSSGAGSNRQSHGSVVSFQGSKSPSTTFLRRMMPGSSRGTVISPAKLPRSDSMLCHDNEGPLLGDSENESRDPGEASQANREDSMVTHNDGQHFDGGDKEFDRFDSFFNDDDDCGDVSHADADESEPEVYVSTSFQPMGSDCSRYGSPTRSSNRSEGHAEAFASKRSRPSANLRVSIEEGQNEQFEFSTSPGNSNTLAGGGRLSGDTIDTI